MPRLRSRSSSKLRPYGAWGSSSNGPELRAEGGPDNVWIVELGNAEAHGSFDRFRRLVLSASVEVVRSEEAADAIPPSTGALPPFFEELRYASPSLGEMRFGHGAPLEVDGEEIELSGYPRHDNPWAHSEFESSRYQITSGCDATGVKVDFDAPSRVTW